MTEVELLFDSWWVSALVAAVRPGGEQPAGEGQVTVLPALRPVIPGGALRPGWVVCVGGPGRGSLGLALVAGAAGGGGWCAAVGLPDLGVVAAIEMGAEPARLLLVDEPGGRWPDVVAALIDAVDLVLLRPAERPSPTAVRRLMALARRGRCVLVVDGDWPGAQLRLSVAAAEWEGLGDGHGRLAGRRARVAADGRGAAGAGRAAWVWLPGPAGQVSKAPATAHEGPVPRDHHRPVPRDHHGRVA
ncbi:MAG TPA: hypothetical protein VF069_05600 [Streptosporangiaceae bacterium]